MIDMNDWYAARTVSSFKKPLPESIHHTEWQNEAEEKTQNLHKMIRLVLWEKKERISMKNYTVTQNTHHVIKGGRPDLAIYEIDNQYNTHTHRHRSVCARLYFNLQNQSRRRFWNSVICSSILSDSVKAARFPIQSLIRWSGKGYVSLQGVKGAEGSYTKKQLCGSTQTYQAFYGGYISHNATL